MKIKEYAVLNANINMADGSEVMFESKDKNEIVDYLKNINADDETKTVEIYYVDENDDFVEGIDYDLPSNFIKNIEAR